ncbi:MAG: selenium-dependent molybdenum cofactor biosynthesis protein YqeB [Treponemataceae bacterium]
MLVVIKGAGDLASGVAHRLFSSGFSVIMTEIQNPTCVRTSVSFSRCVLQNRVEIDGVHGELVKSEKEAITVCNQKKIAVLVDECATIISKLSPCVVVDAIMAKKNINTTKNDAKIVIALGPGFTSPRDCHAVIETNRGHYLGKAIYDGCAEKNTGIPGDIAGFTSERIIRASTDGIFTPFVEIGDAVTKGEKIAEVSGTPIYAEIAGVVRGLLFANTPVFKGMKAGDIDPRAKREYCFSISDKARSIAGGVLEAILHLS